MVLYFSRGRLSSEDEQLFSFVNASTSAKNTVKCKRIGHENEGESENDLATISDPDRSEQLDQSLSTDMESLEGSESDSDITGEEEDEGCLVFAFSGSLSYYC